MSLKDFAGLLPEFAKDIRLNVGSLLNEPLHNEQRKNGRRHRRGDPGLGADRCGDEGSRDGPRRHGLNRWYSCESRNPGLRTPRLGPWVPAFAGTRRQLSAWLFVLLLVFVCCVLFLVFCVWVGLRFVC